MILVVASSNTELQAFDSKDGFRAISIGVGKVAAAAATAKAMVDYHPQAVIGIGTCKSLVDAYTIGDVLVASEVIQYDLDLRLFGLSRAQTFSADRKAVGPLVPELSTYGVPPRFPLVTIGTADMFLTTSKTRMMPYLTEELHVDAVDMESYAIVYVAKAFAIPSLIVRCVSDTSHGHIPKHYDNFLKCASESMKIAVLEILNQTVPSEKSPMIL
jgi:adenosylhomocysteine nucleosidase